MPNTASFASGTKKNPGNNRSWIFWTVAFSVFCLDRISKEGALYFLGEGCSRRFFRFFSLTCIRNKGICFGLFDGAGTRLPLIIASAAILLFIVWYNLVHTESAAQRWASGLIAGGVLGNLYDRILLRGVVDFLNFHVWPVFNIADTCIVTGVSLLILQQLIISRKNVPDVS